MPRGRKKKSNEEIELFKTIEALLGRGLTAKESSNIAQSARNFVRDNFLVTAVYDSDTISEAADPDVEEEDDPLDIEDVEVIRDDYSGRGMGDDNE